MSGLLEENFIQKIKAMMSTNEDYYSEYIYNFYWRNALRSMPLISGYKILDKSQVEESIFYSTNLDGCLYRIFNIIDHAMYSKYNYDLLKNRIIKIENTEPIKKDFIYCLRDINNRPIYTFKINRDEDFHKIFTWTKIFIPLNIYPNQRLESTISLRSFRLAIKAIEQFLGQKKAEKYQYAFYYELGISEYEEDFQIEDYGDFWNAFMELLNKNGCNYWAKFYQKFFRNNFVITDEDIAEIRVRVQLFKVLHRCNRLASYISNQMIGYHKGEVSESDFIYSQYLKMIEDLKNCPECSKIFSKDLNAL